MRKIWAVFQNFGKDFSDRSARVEAGSVKITDVWRTLIIVLTGGASFASALQNISLWGLPASIVPVVILSITFLWCLHVVSAKAEQIVESPIILSSESVTQMQYTFGQSSRLLAKVGLAISFVLIPKALIDTAQSIRANKVSVEQIVVSELNDDGAAIAVTSPEVAIAVANPEAIAATSPQASTGASSPNAAISASKPATSAHSFTQEPSAPTSKEVYPKTHNYRFEITVHNNTSTDTLIREITIKAQHPGRSGACAFPEHAVFRIKDKLSILRTEKSRKSVVGKFEEQIQGQGATVLATGEIYENLCSHKVVLTLDMPVSVVLPANKYSVIYVVVPERFQVVESESNREGVDVGSANFIGYFENYSFDMLTSQGDTLTYRVAYKGPDYPDE